MKPFIAALAALLLFAPTATAEPDGAVRAYVSEYGPAVCSVLDESPIVESVLGVGMAIAEDGLTDYQAGQVIAMSVATLCPWHTGLLRRFIAAAPKNRVTT